ncbi:hypothetical protein [Ruminococcus champanellensis]
MAFDGSLKFDTAVDSKGFHSGIEKIGSLAADGCKAVAGAFAAAYAAAGAAVAGLTKTAVENYADYEQLVGGVETLFKDSADTVMDYANAAFETAGLSANAYMETVTSFSASLLQSLGGDTVEAADKANMAIVDMSDNANKMGTDMASIQNAYQGFAKQNYTMLDNLKLGYGGTKKEMERLLADAQKISGVKYNVESFSDIVDAIHVIQTEMDITGTTAKEASTTIQGSVNAAKSAWTNWVTGLADNSQDFGQLTEKSDQQRGDRRGKYHPPDRGDSAQRGQRNQRDDQHCGGHAAGSAAPVRPDGRRCHRCSHIRTQQRRRTGGCSRPDGDHYHRFCRGAAAGIRECGHQPAGIPDRGIAGQH